jgi:hypothetical protein
VRGKETTEAQERAKTSMALPKKLWTEIRMRALQEGRDAQEIVAEPLEDYLRKKKGGDRR